MANILPREKQITAISALAEGSSIRSVERMTGIHRDTIMRLGVRVGEACQKFMDEKLRDLACRRIQVDEIWGFIGKKQAQTRPGEARKGLGDVWTFVAIDRDTKLVPSFVVGKRDRYTAHVFMEDLSARMKNRIQLSSDAMGAYMEAVEAGFGVEVDYGQIVKTYESPEVIEQRRYSPPEVVSVDRSVITGDPRRADISTSHVERQNLTMRMHMRRLTRLTNAFSKKLENFKAAAALHFGYYNLVKTHSSIRCTPAMAAGVLPSAMSVGDLVEMAA